MEEEWPSLQQQENVHVSKKAVRAQTHNSSWAMEAEREEARQSYREPYRKEERGYDDNYSKERYTDDRVQSDNRRTGRGRGYRGNRRGYQEERNDQQQQRTVDRGEGDNNEYERQWGFKGQGGPGRTAQNSGEGDSRSAAGDIKRAAGDIESAVGDSKSAEERAHDAYLERQNRRNERYRNDSSTTEFNREDYERTGRQSKQEQDQGSERRDRQQDGGRRDNYHDRREQDLSKGHKQQWVNSNYRSEPSSSGGRYRQESSRQDARYDTRYEKRNTRNESKDSRYESQDARYDTQDSYSNQRRQGSGYRDNRRQETTSPRAGGRAPSSENGEESGQISEEPVREVEKEESQPRRQRESKAYSRDRRQRSTRQDSKEDPPEQIIDEEEKEGLRKLVKELKVSMQDGTAWSHGDQDVQSKLETRPIIEPVGVEGKVILTLM